MGLRSRARLLMRFVGRGEEPHPTVVDCSRSVVVHGAVTWDLESFARDEEMPCSMGLRSRARLLMRYVGRGEEPHPTVVDCSRSVVVHGTEAWDLESFAHDEGLPCSMGL